MFRLALLIIALAYMPEPSPAKTLSDTLEKLYKKWETLTVPPPSLLSNVDLSERPRNNKLGDLNSLGSGEDWSEDVLTDDEEEVLSAVQTWGAVSPAQLANLIKEFQDMRKEKNSVVLDKNSNQSEKFGEGLEEEAGSEDEDEDITSLDYAMDEEEPWDNDEDPMATTDAARRVLMPSSERPMTIDPVTATAERPRIIDDSSLSVAERSQVRRDAIAHMRRAVRAAKCLEPQPRWLNVRQLAPAADTVYMPPCVMLHRCAVDTGCCYSEAEVCAPIAGEYVTLPLLLNKADGNLIPARMLFYNHTRCACVPRDGEGQKDAGRVRTESPRLADYLQSPSSYVPLMGVTEMHTAPPALRRCSCPTLFLPQTLTDGECECTCRWAEAVRRRECLSLARGREHFGIRDRMCVTKGQCSLPNCEYGVYDRTSGRCPPRPHRRLRSRYQKTIQM